MIFFAEAPIRFDQPIWLLLLLLLIPTILIARRSIGGLSRTKAYLTLALRSVLIVVLAVALAVPSWVERGEGLTVTLILDRSQSIPVALKTSVVDFLQRAVDTKTHDEDRVSVVITSRDASITAMPDVYSAVTVGADDGDPTATNLAAGVRLALAVMPDDTANRMVLVSDGNETADSVMAAAELARANDVPIDVLLLDYEYENEVLFDRIIAPARAREGQTARVRLVLRSQSAAAGTIRMTINGEPLDLNGVDAGDGLPVMLEPGTNAFEQMISLDASGPHEFQAVFVPDDPAADAMDRNNSAVAVTFVGGEGKVLVVTEEAGQARYLIEALEESGITVDVRSPSALDGGLVLLSGYDTVILVNTARWAFDQEQDRMLHAYVHDLGGGLIMTGGPQAFGAGGWIDSEVAHALPVELNPPATRQMPAGALALIMHSCEMPQGNYWGQQVAQASIEALSRLDYVGIVEFNWGAPGGIQGCSWAFPMQRLGNKAAALESTKTMQVGDMPAFAPSMQLALQGLTNTAAAQRHAIIISDGDPQPPSQALLNEFVDKKVTVTTVMVGGHGTALDRTRMQAVAQKTGGQFYNVRNPKQLPQIFIKEARIVSRSLIQDGDVYLPSVGMVLPGPVQGFSGVPAVDGYVLTAPREGLAQTPIIIPTTEGNDPLFAYWNFGLGRSIAYTSDVANLWGARWASWERYRAFWEQAVRWSMRPSTPTDVTVSTRFEGDLAIVELEASDLEDSVNFQSTGAVVLRPDTTPDVLELQQIGPGRFRGQFRTDTAGAYLVNIGYQSGTGDARGLGNIQAAVTVPYPAEFRAVKHNLALLEDLAEATGGRVLDASDPQLVDLFRRTDLELPRTMKRMWDVLAILAAALLLLDVAARRITLDPARAKTLAERAVGRRGEVGDATVAAWKRTRAQVAHRRTEDGASRRARFEATEEDSQRAIDVGAESATGGQARPPRAATAAPTDAAPDDGDEAEYTSRLLAAKRRARSDGPGDDRTGGPGS